MSQPSLQDGIDKAGSPINLLWKPNSPPATVPVIEPEYAGWAEEQAAWRDTVAISDLSFHMWDTFLDGPDATRLLMAVSANDYENFAIGQAKQFVPVTEEGFILSDGILMRNGPDSYTLSGVPASQTWVRYHAQKGGYNVDIKVDPDSFFRKDAPPVLFRFQVQGPRAPEVIERAFGGPLPEAKFFHTIPVSLAGAKFRAFRHGMAGQAGYEFIGDHKDYAAVKDALMKAGKPSDMIHVGGKAYYTNGIESGWIPTPTPGIYTAPELADYRRYVPLYSYEGMRGIHGTYYSDNIEDYYVSPYELGYGRSVKFNHDFIGRAALEKAKDRVKRTKVTLAVNRDDVRDAFGDDHGFILSYARYRIEANKRPIGMTFYTGYIDPVGTILALSLVDNEYAKPGRKRRWSGANIRGRARHRARIRGLSACAPLSIRRHTTSTHAPSIASSLTARARSESTRCPASDCAVRCNTPRSARRRRSTSH